jgi:hypothetical protein
LFSVLVIIVGIVVVHELPGKIAAKRNHPQLEAIKVTSYLGLLIFPLWMAALIWAHFRPWRIAGFNSDGAKPDFGRPAEPGEASPKEQDRPDKTGE